MLLQYESRAHSCVGFKPYWQHSSLEHVGVFVFTEQTTFDSKCARHKKGNST